MIPDDVKKGVEELLTATFNKQTTISTYSSAAGGCINNGGKIVTSSGIFFVKWNDRGKFPDMFVREAEGLKELQEPAAIRIPEVVGVGETKSNQYLILEYIESHSPAPDFSLRTARGLSKLHHSKSKRYGWKASNYMGSLVQHNDYSDSWIDFFVERRLEVQLKLAVDKGEMGSDAIRIFEKLYKELPSILSEEEPTLVHGDLWGGNLMRDEKGYPCLIDPAVYYGHREVDLAMTQLFGGFDDTFYSIYQEEYSTPPGLQQRLDIYNLYPLLVHVNLFGGGYVSQVMSIVRRFR